ncbi:hypothetical protein BH23BAC1_BH23BAC1_10940 [soil metagenome]
MLRLIAGDSTGIPFFGTGIGIAGIIFFPLLYGIFGLVFEALGAFIYNFIAKIGGGLEIEIVGKEELKHIYKFIFV